MPRTAPLVWLHFSLHALLLSSHAANGFRFGGSGRDLLHDAKNRRQQQVASSSPAATKGSGGDREASSSQTSSPRRSKAKDLPRGFPLRNIPLFDDGVARSHKTRSSERDDGASAVRSAAAKDADETSTEDSARNLEDDESFHSIVNDMVENIQKINSPVSRKVAGEIELGDDDDDAIGGTAARRPNGKRVTFFASKACSRTISLDDKYSQLLDEYMTLPLEQYSVKSFHDGGPSSKMEGRRWFLRRLSADESAQYVAFEPRDNHEDYIIQSDHGHGRFFRLAVPLAPLIGIELTPVIDLEVIPALKQPLTMEGSEEVQATDIQPKPAPGSHDSKEDKVSALSQRPRRRPLRAVRRILRRSRRNQQSDGESTDDLGEIGVVRVQSLRVALLSTEDEVKALMKTRKRASKPIDKPTQVSQNPSVQQIGKETVGVVGKIEEALEPHITFDATITWDQHAPSGPSVTVTSTAVTSLSIPKRARAFRVPLPLPLGVLVRRIGSLLTKKALEITLPRFLRQLERDLERWGRGEQRR